MKKVVALVLSLFLVSFLAACGGEESSGGNTNDPGEDKTEQQEGQTDEGEKEEDSNTDGNVKESEVGKLTVAKQKKELNETVESGPMALTINAIQTATLEPSEEYKEFFDGKETVTIVTVNMKAENTSEDTIGFYPDQAVLTTDAGDQVDADMFLSDDVGGEFFGKVKKEGNVIFQLDTPAEEINSLKLIIFGAQDEDFNSLSDDLQIELSF